MSTPETTDQPDEDYPDISEMVLAIEQSHDALRACLEVGVGGTKAGIAFASCRSILDQIARVGAAELRAAVGLQSGVPDVAG